MSAPACYTHRMERRIDVRGLSCPAPVVRAGEALAKVDAGVEIVVLADDPFATLDLRAYCHAHRHRFVGHRMLGEAIEIRLRKGCGNAVG